MTQSWTRAFAVMGALVVIQTILWEMVRMKPDYRFIVNPWALRGFELDQGWAYLAIGVAMLIAVLLVQWRPSENLGVGAGVIVFMIAAAAGIAGYFGGGDEWTVTEGLAGLLARLITILFTGTALSRGIRPGLAVIERSIRQSTGRPLKRGRHGEDPLLVERGPGRFLLWLVSIALATLFWLWAFSQFDLSIHPGLAVLFGGLIMALYSLTAAPRNLAPSRMLVLMVLLAMVIMVTMAGAMRTALLEAQVEESGVAADYEDTQVAAGYFVMIGGMVLVFIGSVAIWAKRKDQLDAQARAEKQRRAAAKSAAEIEAAREAAGVTAGTGASSGADPPDG